MSDGHPNVEKIDTAQLRAEVDRLIGEGQGAAAHVTLARLWRAAPDSSTAGFVVGRAEKIKPLLAAKAGEGPTRPACRIAILRSFTVEPMVPMLKASVIAAGADPEVYLSEFNAYVQDIINPAGALYQFNPTVAVLAVLARDLVPELWTDFVTLEPAQVDQVVARVLDGYKSWIDGFRAHSKAHLIVHNLEMPEHAASGVFDAIAERSQVEAFQKINAGIAALARAKSNVYVLDYAGLVARVGGAAWRDERKWLTVRMPIAAGRMIEMVREWMRFLHPITGKTCKALVLDLDNTMWGGVIGEDGMNGIKLDGEYPGAAFQAFQRVANDLFERGIILAINSKNNAADALEAIQQHPGMVLKPDQFAVMKINWQDKAQNLREIAKELNIGIDSLAFFDDNPVERRWVSEQLPEVTVIDVPTDPMLYADTLRRCPVFERLSLSAEDRVRGRMYAENRLRTELMTQAASMDDFYYSLAMEMELMDVTPANLARVAQLTQKTNQFNLTTKRYTEEQVKEMAASRDWRLCAVRVKDRFGDNGIVGVSFLKIEGAAAEVDTLLLSCRVIGRTIETAFLSHLADQAMAAGAAQLHGWYLPTKKNPPCKEFYTQHQFKALETTPTGGIHYAFNLRAGKIEWPKWITKVSSTVGAAS